MMTDYEIYDLLYSNFKDKFDDDNIVFTQKYMVGHQKIHICHLKVKKKIDAFDCLDFLNKLQEKYKMVSIFIFNHFDVNNNICVYQFVSENEEKKRRRRSFSDRTQPGG